MVRRAVGAPRPSWLPGALGCGANERRTPRWRLTRVHVLGTLVGLLLIGITAHVWFLHKCTLEERDWEERSLRGATSFLHMPTGSTPSDVDHTLISLTRQRGETMRVMVTAMDRPFDGGGSTNAYYVVQTLRHRYHLPVAAVFFSYKTSPSEDPLDIGGCFGFSRAESTPAHRDEQRARVVAYLGGVPDLIIAFVSRATLLSRHLFPDVFLVQVTTGSVVLSEAGDSFQRILWNPLFRPRVSNMKEEIEAMTLVNEMHYVSFHVWRAYDRFYPHIPLLPQGVLDVTAFMYDVAKDRAIALKSEEEEQQQHSFHVAFVVSDINRRVKNRQLMERIFLHKRMRSLRKLVIGRDAPSLCEKLPNTEVYDLLPHDQVLRFLSRTHVLIIPSFFESTPNTAAEAISLGAVPVLSKNVGYWATFPPMVVCEDVHDVEEWVQAILYGLEHREDVVSAIRESLLHRRDEFVEHQLPSLLIRALRRLL